MEQTVGRSAFRAPARGAVAAQGDDARPPRIRLPHELVVALLPVRTARELAVGLARQWHTWSGARASVVVVGLVPVARTYVAQSRHGELPSVAHASLDRKQAEAGFRNLIFSERRGHVSDEPCVATVAFPTGPDTVGGVCLFSANRLDLPAEACEEFASLSGALIKQAAVIEESLPALCSLESAKAEALAEFAAGAGHEINNPLATISGRVQILLRDEPDPNRRQELATIGAQALRVRDMIGDLMVFGRPPIPVPERILLNDFAQKVVGRFAEQARACSCHITLLAAGPVFATADPTQLQIALSELIRNSLEALAGAGDATDHDSLNPSDFRGEIFVRLERSTSAECAAAVLSVTDNGPGLSDKDRAHLFDPFYSGRDAGRGLGFGLCKCWRIVKAHGGAIVVDSIPNVATTFEVVWPDEPPKAPSLSP